nr:translation initiation factor IF-2-like [Pan troglodytes]
MERVRPVRPPPRDPASPGRGVAAARGSPSLPSPNPRSRGPTTAWHSRERAASELPAPRSRLSPAGNGASHGVPRRPRGSARRVRKPPPAPPAAWSLRNAGQRRDTEPPGTETPQWLRRLPGGPRRGRGARSLLPLAGVFPAHRPRPVRSKRAFHSASSYLTNVKKREGGRPRSPTRVPAGPLPPEAPAATWRLRGGRGPVPGATAGRDPRAWGAPPGDRGGHGGAPGTLAKFRFTGQPASDLLTPFFTRGAPPRFTCQPLSLLCQSLCSSWSLSVSSLSLRLYLSIFCLSLFLSLCVSLISDSIFLSLLFCFYLFLSLSVLCLSLFSVSVLRISLSSLCVCPGPGPLHPFTPRAAHLCLSCPCPGPGLFPSSACRRPVSCTPPRPPSFLVPHLLHLSASSICWSSRDPLSVPRPCSRCDMVWLWVPTQISR